MKLGRSQPTLQNLELLKILLNFVVLVLCVAIFLLLPKSSGAISVCHREIPVKIEAKTFLINARFLNFVMIFNAAFVGGEFSRLGLNIFLVLKVIGRDSLLQLDEVYTGILVGMFCCECLEGSFPRLTDVSVWE